MAQIWVNIPYMEHLGHGEFMVIGRNCNRNREELMAWMPSTEGISSPLKVFSMSLAVETASRAPVVLDMSKSLKREFLWIVEYYRDGID